MLEEDKNIATESISIMEIPTVLDPPISLKSADEYINCPICEISIDLKDQLIDNDCFAYCEDCNHKILFKIVKI